MMHFRRIDIIGKLKKNSANENHARRNYIRFGHWEDDCFLGMGNKESLGAFTLYLTPASVQS